jgi:glycine/D-amino acid oxidase-like deaminating enzyme
MNTDFLIIGQGLAGSLLAWELIQRGRKVVIIDNGRENASQVAAGLINPVTGLRLVKSIDADRLLPAAKRYYSNLSGFFHQPFYIEKAMLRLFRSEAEVKHGWKRLDDPAYENYLGAIARPGTPLPSLETPFGFMAQKQTGYLLTRPFLRCLKEFFIASGCYRLAEFDDRDIQLEPSLRWQDISARQIIFCAGHHASRDSWFSWLPFQPAKGEILTLSHTDQLPDKILNYGNWLIPLSDSQIRTGATFERDTLNTGVTDTARSALLAALQQLAPALKTTLINQQAGIRPCTRDRHPFIGHHPRHPRIAIFNGFGAKGSLQIPWYSQRFADCLLNNTPLPLSCDIQRYHETHFPG